MNPNTHGKIVSFIKAGGGVGATTLAVQAACARANQGLALVDLDIQYGAAAFQLDLASDLSILDLTAAVDRLDPVLLRGAMVRAHDAFDLLPAPDGVYPLEDVSAAAVTSVLELARASYTTVLVDLPPVWNQWSYAALSRSDHIVLVVRLTLPSLRQARRQIEMLKREFLGDKPLFVVANRVETAWFSPQISREQGERALGRAIDALVPHDNAIALAAASGLPLAAVGAKASVRRIGAMLDAVLASDKTKLQELV